jgi:alpha-tubulin suppressor-like RCC1 family protein
MFSCAQTPASVMWCWGDSTGAVTPSQKTMPAGVTFQSISVGNSGCGLTSVGAAYCWGFNDQGQLGDGTWTERAIPVPVQMPAGVTFTSIAVATGALGSHACGLSAVGTAYCWGANDSGQLGDNTNTARPLPAAVSMPAGVTFTSLGVGSQHNCGLTAAGEVWCWGDNEQGGQLGDGTTQDRLAPTKVVMPAGVTFASISISGHHSCALTATGAPYCWGWNSRGQLGDGTQSSRSIPTAVVMPAGVTFTSIDAGYYNTCALAVGGVAYCWGRNVFGEVGDGSTASQRLTPVPVAMPVGVTFASIVTGWNHSCGLSPGGQAWCWGTNSRGQLGDGTTIDRTTPAKVLQ